MRIRHLLSPIIFSVALFAVMMPSVIKAAEIELLDGFEPGQKLVLISGPIETGDDSRFYELAKQADRAIVLLESPGGSVDAGLSIGAEIAIKGFTTLVLDGDGCHSICAVIWVSGTRRYMSPNANISVHAAYRLAANADGEPGAAESGVANANIGAYLNEIGLSRMAIEYFTAARPDEPMLPITPEIAQVLDIDVYLQDGERVIAPSERPTPRRITRQVSEYVGMSTNCTELFGVDPQFWEAQAEIVLKHGHALFGGEAFGPLLPEYSYALKTALQRDGLVRWCIAVETNLRMDGLPTGITGPSFDCGRAGTSTELAVCDSEQLWVLDNAMANLYFFYKRNQNAGRSAEFLDSQRVWLQRRDACGASLDCLTERYLSRLFDFRL
jgi:hypothetical protein